MFRTSVIGNVCKPGENSDKYGAYGALFCLTLHFSALWKSLHSMSEKRKIADDGKRKNVDLWEKECLKWKHRQYFIDKLLINTILARVTQDVRPIWALFKSFSILAESSIIRKSNWKHGLCRLWKDDHVTRLVDESEVWHLEIIAKLAPAQGEDGQVKS